MTADYTVNPKEVGEDTMEMNKTINDTMEMMKTNNDTDIMPAAEIAKGVSLLIIWLIAVFGNLLTVAVVIRYKLRRIPDILVLAMACTDLVAAAFPIPASAWLYFSTQDPSPLQACKELCQAYAVVAEFTRYSAALLVTLLLVDRFVWILRPIQYHLGLYRPYFFVSVAITWIIALILSLMSLGVDILVGDNTCLFKMNTWYGIVIAVFGGVQFLTVFVTFCVILFEVIKLARRRKKMVVQDQKSDGCTSSSKKDVINKDQFSLQEKGETKSEMKKDSKLDANPDCSSKLKQFFKCVKEKVHPSSEQQFAIMFTAIVLLFYISWLPIIMLLIYTLAANMDESSPEHQEALFYMIRFTVIGAAINPFLYGILGRAYRRVYVFYTRRILGKCFPCIRQPSESENPYLEDSRS